MTTINNYNLKQEKAVWAIKDFLKEYGVIKYEEFAPGIIIVHALSTKFNYGFYAWLDKSKPDFELPITLRHIEGFIYVIVV